VEDETDDTLLQVRPAFGNLKVKLFQVFDSPRRLLHLTLVLLAVLGDCRILAIDELAHPGDHVPPHRDGVSEVVDGGHHGVCSILVTHIAKCDNLLAGLAGLLGRHARVGVRGRRASDVGSGEKDEAVVICAEAEVEGAGALVVGCLERGGRSQAWLAERGDAVDGIEGEELRATNRVGHL